MVDGVIDGDCLYPTLLSYGVFLPSLETVE
jgi:hypothetical protein